MTLIDQIIIGLYLLAILTIGLFSSRDNKDIESYSVAGRQYGALIIFATLSASFIGGGFTIGNAEKVFRLGLVSSFAILGFSLKEVLVATVIAPKMAKFKNAISVGDIMSQAYGERARIAAGVLSLCLCAGIVGAQTSAIGHVFYVFLGISPTVGILLGSGIVIMYSVVGGMRAVINTDIFQFVLLAVGIPVACFIGIDAAGGWGAIAAAVPAGHLSFFDSEFTLIVFVSLFLTFMLGEAFVPPYLQRLLIGRNVAHTVGGTFLSALFSIPFIIITGMIGLVALTLKPDLNPNQALPYVVQTVLPIGVKGFVAAGIVAVVMSSADSFLNSASVAFTKDILMPVRKQPLSGRQSLLVARWATLVVGIISVVFPLTITSVMDCLIYAYNFWAPTILVPLVAALLGFRASVGIFFLSALAGVCANLAWGQLASSVGVDGLVIGVLANLIVFLMLMKKCSVRE